MAEGTLHIALHTAETCNISRRPDHLVLDALVVPDGLGKIVALQGLVVEVLHCMGKRRTCQLLNNYGLTTLTRPKFLTNVVAAVYWHRERFPSQMLQRAGQSQVYRYQSFWYMLKDRNDLWQEAVTCFVIQQRIRHTRTLRIIKLVHIPAGHKFTPLLTHL